MIIITIVYGYGGNISANNLQGLHEGLGARLGDGSKVIDEISFGHTDTSIDDGQRFGLGIGDNLNFQILAGIEP